MSGARIELSTDWKDEGWAWSADQYRAFEDLLLAAAPLFGRRLGCFFRGSEFLGIEHIVVVAVGAIEDRGRTVDEFFLADLTIAVGVELAHQHFATATVLLASRCE